MSNRISQKMQEGVAAGVFPGGVLLIYSQGEVRFHQAFGSASLIPNQVPMTCDTLFDLASLTKPLATAAAILILIQNDLLALTDPLSKFFPEFTFGAKREITLYHLLNHSAGLPDWRPYYQEIAEQEEKDPGFLGSSAAKRKICQRVKEEPLIAYPGAKSLYSDLGFILLGEVVEAVATEPLHRFCYRNIFSKHDCKETFFIRLGRRPQAYRGRLFAATEECPWRGKVIRGWVHDDNAYAMGGVAGHAGLFSTAWEVYRLVRLWIDSIEGTGPLNSTLATLFTTCQKGNDIPVGSSWGLGWDTPSHPRSSSGRFFSPMSFGHLGFTGTSIWVDRKRDLIVILLTNRVHPSRDNSEIRLFRPELHDLIFEEVVGV
ncbi:serine hydrolase [Candidatus Manganitrophus noduliformans]|uniref:Beta-lactamase family protein n=1 Tax=Candidatus Manganitrophus noduliformans TaxID=2606439 RepID=A0A7X6DQZ7_9BACT|nr:serine hydrolase domain-containing protein [Candidatus Manganitrophus noduliformans]NKE71584.1 beta-lactamase family protein [Candidatus Manganitrophus noduliformans]